MRIQFGVFFLAVLLTSTAASAQEGGARVSGFFGGAFGEGGAAIATGGSVGYRFTPRLGFDFEVLTMPDTHFDRDELNRLRQILNAFPGGLVIPGTYFDTSGRTVAFLTNFVTEFPTASEWLIPYLAGGGGVASVSRNLPVFPLAAVPVVRPGLPTIGGGLPPIFGDIAQQIGSLRRAETDLALTVGGGVDFQVLHGLAVGVDLRYLHLFGISQDLNLARLSGRVTYRF
jgi:opacity protein-like surface antigen